VAEHIGVSFDNLVLWEWKSQELFCISYDLLSDAINEDKVKEDVKQAFLAYLVFFSNSNDKKHSQRKKTVANNHGKGDIEAFRSSCHAALTLMNDFKSLVIEGTAPVTAQGTAFAQKQKGAGTPATGTKCNYNKEYFADKECHNCGKLGHPSRCCTQKKKGKAKKDSEDDKPVSSNKSAKTIKLLTKQVKTLKKRVSALQAHQEDSNDNSSLSSEEVDTHFQYACAAIATNHPEVALALLKSHKARDLDLKSMWLLDNQSTFDLCCNPDFAHKR
jgi:hypothetical protein